MRSLVPFFIGRWGKTWLRDPTLSCGSTEMAPLSAPASSRAHQQVRHGRWAFARIAEVDVAGVLVPRELHAGVGAVGTGLHHPCSLKRNTSGPWEGRGGLAHKVVEDEPGQALAAAMSDAEHVGAEAVEMAVHAGDERNAFSPKHDEVDVIDCRFEHREPPALELFTMPRLNARCDRNATSCKVEFTSRVFCNWLFYCVFITQVKSARAPCPPLLATSSERAPF